MESHEKQGWHCACCWAASPDAFGAVLVKSEWQFQGEAQPWSWYVLTKLLRNWNDWTIMRPNKDVSSVRKKLVEHNLNFWAKTFFGQSKDTFLKKKTIFKLFMHTKKSSFEHLNVFGPTSFLVLKVRQVLGWTSHLFFCTWGPWYYLFNVLFWKLWPLPCHL